MSSRRKRGWAHHQPEAVVLDFVNSEFLAAFFFSALRFLVAVSSDLSGCSCVLKALFSKLSRWPRYSRSLIRSFFFIAPPRYQGPIAQHTSWRSSASGEAALAIKISVRFNMPCKVYSWDRARRCTICDSVIVRSARRRTAKNEWLPHASLITLCQLR